jgi:hypothetical protein
LITNLLPASTTASFFLPGLIHQFGNLLLTVQGHVLHLQPDGIQRMQDAVLGVVQRGGASLQVVRALLGEQTGATGAAGDLVAQVLELGRVPARECGISLELRGKPLAHEVWVPAEPFVLACAEALRRWVHGIPTGTCGVITVELLSASADQVVVLYGFEAMVGSLPFPIAADEVLHDLGDLLEAAGGTGRILTVSSAEQATLELQFGAG